MTGSKTDGGAPDQPDARAAAKREAKGSVQEAIGKLIGDDDARDRGNAEKRAAEEAASPAGKRSGR